MRAPRLLAIGLVCLLAAPLFAATAGDSAPDGARVLADIRAFFKDAEVRHPGSRGNLLIERRVAGEFAKSGFRHGEIRFYAPVFQPGRTVISAKGLPPIRVLPMHPTVFRPGNFLEQDFKTRLVYLGHGTVADLAALKGVPLDGAVGVMEFNCGTTWQRFLRFGIRGFIFIERDEYSHWETAAKVYSTEVSVPRFFVNAADGARLKTAIGGSSRSLDVRVEAEPSRWRNAMLRDLWVLIPGRSPELGKEACAVVAPMDSNCVVPEMAVGAQAGANLYLLMQLLREFKETRPERSILLVAVNAHTQNYLGERMLAWHLLAPESQVEAVRDLLAAEMRTQELLLKYYRRLKLDPPDQATGDLLVEMRALVDDSTGKKVQIKNPITALAKRDVNQLKAQKVLVHRSDRSEAEKEKELERLDELRIRHLNVLMLFNRVGIRTELSDLSKGELAVLKQYVDEVMATNATWARLNRRDLMIDVANGAVREALAGRKVPVSFTLDLTWRNDRIGFCSLNNVAPYATKRAAHEFGKGTSEIAAALAKREGREKADYFVDTMTKRGSHIEEHYFPVYESAVHCFHAVEKTPAFSLRNVFVGSGAAFSPADTFDRLPAANVAALTAYVPRLLRAILADSNVTSSSGLKRPHPRDYHLGFFKYVRAFKFDEFSASVSPELPVPGTAIVLIASRGRPKPLVGGDVVNAYVALTDTRASWIFRGVDLAWAASSAFHYDADFTVVDHAIDAGEIQERVDSNITSAARGLLALFPCREIPLYERSDASLVSATPISIKAIRLLGAARGDTALRKYGLAGIGAVGGSGRWIPTSEMPGAIFVEKEEAVKLVTGQKRFALNASAEKPEGVGFSAGTKIGPDFFDIAVRDMSILNRHRLEKMRGVSDQLAREFLERGDSALAKVDAAKSAHDHVGYLRALYEALGAQAKAHAWTSAITNDMLKAIVFYMALLLPFCFFVQKLLFKFVRIEAQMAAFVALFLLTYLVFRLIHPAFLVAKAPAAILIAFVMGALGLFVIYILHSRFEGEMQLLFRTYTVTGASDIGYSTASREAMLIGVSNMKRRRVRTILTTGTIVLVTFSMLAFSSVSQKVSPTIIPITQNPSRTYTGLFYQWPGNRRMDEASLQVFLDLFSGRGQVIVRRWLLSPQSKQWGGPFELGATCSTGRRMRVEAVLGVPAAEDGFLARMPILPGGRFFRSDDAHEVVLGVAAAKELQIPAEQIAAAGGPNGAAGGRAPATLMFGDHELTVVGLVNDAQLRSIKDLNNLPILPIRDIQKRDQLQSEVMAPEDGEAAEESGISFVETSLLLIVPVNTAKRLGAKPFSVSIRFRDDEPIWPVVDQVLTVTRAKFYVGSRVPFTIGLEGRHVSPAGSYYIGSGYKTSVGGLTRLIIPLLIAGTIIFNTILGTVYERKHEIAIYNAVGLNPTHIGLFFLAEAFVYGVIGSVGGYLIGQVLAIGLTEFELIKGINLNFSSLSVVYVILFTIGVVLLSTIYPAVMATRAAVPSGKRKWSMPERAGNRMTVVFPFIYRPSLVGGVMAYLEEYFTRFTEASTGTLIATLEQRIKGTDDEERETYTLAYDTALSPYDLGVTQKVTFHAAHDETVQNHRLIMTIDRISGQDSAWVTTNKPFLERLRKYLMHWRNLDAAQHTLYCERAAEFFEQAARDGSEEQREQ